MAKKLSRKREAFVNEYVKCWNGAESARKAGYSERNAASTACNLLKLPIIIKIIADYKENMKMDAEEALQLLGETARDAKAESVRLRALENVLKVHGLQTERHEGEVTVNFEWKDAPKKRD